MAFRVLFTTGAMLLLGITTLLSQNFPVTPASPTEFKKRNLGGTLGTGVTGIQRVKTKPVVLHYIAVSDERPFVSTDGKKINATLLAFEEGDPTKAKKPLTLIKDGKIRLLVKGKQKASLLPLARLREEDQDYVQAVVKASKAAVPKSE